MQKHKLLPRKFVILLPYRTYSDTYNRIGSLTKVTYMNGNENSLIKGQALIIPGAQKAATTAVFNQLCKHPGFVTPRYKEPQVLSLKGDLPPEALTWYQHVLSPSQGYFTLDASTSYLLSPAAAKRSRDLFEDPFIVIMLRDPVRRAFSAYLELWKRGPSMESRSFDKIIEDMGQCDLDCPDLFSIERDSAIMAFKSGLINLDYSGRGYHRRVLDKNAFEAEFEIPEWPFMYFSGSQYSESVFRYQESNPGRVKFVLFEEFVRDPAGTIFEILKFIGLKNAFPAEDTAPIYPTFVPKGSLGGFVRKYEIPKLLRSRGKVGTRLANYLEKKTYHKPTLSGTTYHKARKILEPEYEFWLKRIPSTQMLWRFK